MGKNNKEHLYSVIFKLFLSKDYKSVTIQDIEDASGMTRGAVFYYAPNKLTLFRQVVEEYFFKAQDLVDKLESVEETGDGTHTLLDFIYRYVQAVEARMMKLQEELGMNRADASRSYLRFILLAQDYYEGFNERMTEVFLQELEMWKKVLILAQQQHEIREDVEIDFYANLFRNFYVGKCYHAALMKGINPAELHFELMKIYQMIKA